jgi:fructose-1-phosphate kinase PfkB-like protein
MSVTSMASIDSDFSSGFRLDETMAGGNNRYLHVISVDGSVSSTAAAGDATHPGVTVRLANGHTATVTFARDTTGATLVLDSTTKTLAPGVDQLPE